jgi:hypothetical protein
MRTAPGLLLFYIFISHRSDSIMYAAGPLSLLHISCTWTTVVGGRRPATTPAPTAQLRPGLCEAIRLPVRWSAGGAVRLARPCARGSTPANEGKLRALRRATSAWSCSSWTACSGGGQGGRGSLVKHALLVLQWIGWLASPVVHGMHLLV